MEFQWVYTMVKSVDTKVASCDSGVYKQHMYLNGTVKGSSKLGRVKQCQFMFFVFQLDQVRPPQLHPNKTILKLH